MKVRCVMTVVDGPDEGQTITVAGESSLPDLLKGVALAWPVLDKSGSEFRHMASLYFTAHVMKDQAAVEAELAEIKAGTHLADLARTGA